MLPVSRLIQVEVNVGAQPVAGRSFNTLLIAGDSNVISGAQRIRSYLDLEDVANDFGITAPEYLAASLYYSQVPQPLNLMIGRWINGATSGFNLGGILTPAQQVLSNWTAITSGGFDVSINGASVETLTALNFSSVTNLNGVASTITAGLTGAVCTWNGESFQITSNTTGPGAQAVGSISFTGQPSANDSFTIGGTAITFVASSPLGNQVVIGASAAATAANLLLFLQQSTDSNIGKCLYAATSSLVIGITYAVVGTAGNSFALVKSGTNLAVSGADLSGGTAPSTVGYATAPGSGTDISAMLALTASLSQALVSGYATESPAACAAALSAKSSVWYGLMFVSNSPAATSQITTAQSLAVSAFVEGLSVTRMYGVTSQDTNTLSSLVSNDLASLMENGAYNQSMIQFSSTSPYAIASIFGRMFSVDFTAQNSTIAIMYKQEPGVTAEQITDQQADVLQAKHCNVFVGYDNATAIIQYGVLSSGNYIDQTWGLDWFQNAMQTAVYNLLYTSTTKIPQTDAGQHQLQNAAAAVCGNQPGGAVYNGLSGPGTWNSTTVFGSLTTGQYLPNGYYIFSSPIDSQSESDRAARKAPPIQVALKLAGAFATADVIVTVNQ